MRTVPQTDLHCELTGLSALRGLSGKPEPARLKTESDSELLSTTLKSLTISSMTGILVQQCLFGMNLYELCAPTHTHAHIWKACKPGGVFDTFTAFGFTRFHPKTPSVSFSSVILFNSTEWIDWNPLSRYRFFYILKATYQNIAHFLVVWIVRPRNLFDVICMNWL